MLDILLILAISVANAENAYQTFGVKLPRNLMSTITAVYADNLYVFGGVNQTTNSLASFNSKFWKLPLSGKFEFSDSTKTDINTTLTDSDWTEITVTAPAYGDSFNNEFKCDGQCSVVIGKYLYIVGPYSSNSTTQSTARTDIYRLDLSTDPPVFAAQNDFTSAIGYTTAARDACVTSANGKMYIISGVSGSTFSLEARIYDPTPADTMSSTVALYTGTGRFLAGCAPNVAEDEIYLAGGRGTYGADANGVPGVDTYDITGNTWTDNADANDFDTGNGRFGEARREIKCFTNYQNTIECPGGWGYVSGSNAVQDNSILWNYDTRANTYVDLATVRRNGLATYEFYSIGDERGSVVFILGGDDGSNDAVDTIQYAVRYALITSPPTGTPTQSPVTTDAPIKAPTANPLCDGCTYAPTQLPTVAPTDGDDHDHDHSDGMRIKVNAFWMGILVIVLPMIY